MTTTTTRRRPKVPPRRTRTRKPTTDVRLGRIVGRFGVHGQLKVDPTRSGTEVLDAGLVVKVGSVGERALRIEDARAHKGQILVRFSELDRSEVEDLIGAELYAGREAVALQAGEYFDDDLMGCAVVDADGNALGDVVGVLHYPGQDLLAVGARRSLIPLVGAFIRRIDVDARRIDVDLPEGLLE
jgi:16S rRNA processing protein RimM